MNVVLSSISSRRSGLTGPASELLVHYLQRASHYVPSSLRIFPTEGKLLDYFAKGVHGTRAALLLGDSRGQEISSEDFANVIGALQDSGIQQLILAIGPASGWSTRAISVATRLVSFGRITLPHELAAVVAAEQVYRALTIRAGHPYHSGH